MQPPPHHSRINLPELKAQIVKKLGPEGSKQYFHYLNRFLSLKLTKTEFNKLCLRILGRENIPLHNQLIRSILRNACTSIVPPNKDDNYLQNGSHIAPTQPSNGVDILPISPKKARTGFRDRRNGPRPSTLGQNVKENGDYLIPLENERKFLESSTRSPLRAPLGVPLCPVSIGGARKAPLPSASSSRRSNGLFDDGVLLDSVTLRERMEQIALSQGLEGVSMDSANILNHGLDIYLKGLLKSCIELVGSRSGHDLTKNSANKQESSMKLINGVRPGYQYQIQNSGTNLDLQEPKNCSISLQDFRIAMELNPRKLGEDWPLLLEKICTRAFEE